MRMLLEHELPRKLRYAKIYLEVGSASLFVSVNGSHASIFGSIGRTAGRVSVSDRDYARYRATVPATELIDCDDGKVIIKNREGAEEEWVTPRWFLARLTAPREKRNEGRSV